MKEKIVEVLNRIIVEDEIAMSKEDVSSQTDFLNEVGLDSLQLINFLIEIEEIFDVTIDYDTFDFEETNTAEKLEEYLKKAN